ncbi:hypothetical protein GL567_06580 [Campylobacter lari]|uniref:WG repeat-containing protein n=1 Tax=Campylobacter lari TaxID=201 RepID=A0A6N6BGR8_CAMLA|nr:hypothetical protein [Campylobacter lari]
MKNGGFINNKGEIVINPIFDEVESFYNKAAIVQLNGKWGFVDTSGNIIK